MNQTTFFNISAKLCGQMLSLDKQTRKEAAVDASDILFNLPKVLSNSPHCFNEIKTIKTLISRVNAE